MKVSRLILLGGALFLGALVPGLLLERARTSAQVISEHPDWFETGINLGASRIRLAVTELPAQSADPSLGNMTKIFNQTLWNDLDNAGIFDLVSKSYFPLQIPKEPEEVVFAQWTDPPASAQMLVFGKTEVINANLVITARLFDVKNPASASVLAKRYVATMNEVSTREAAHRFANEIIRTLGGGVPGINLTRIAFVSNRTGHAEIWVMDYDGFNQRPLTSYGSLALTPRWAPDNSKIAFTSYSRGNPDIFVYSLETNRLIPFPRYKGLNTTPAWSPDGKKIAFCSSMSGDPEIYVSDANGFNLQRLTFSPGVDISPVWNPKTGSEIAFVSDRSGTPQIYIMAADGTNLRRLITGSGDASSPSWSPNGLFIAFHWRQSDTGTYDIYVIEIATGRIIQLTHDAARNESPGWSPDGRHLVFQSTRTGRRQIWTMLADGREPKQLTEQGDNWNPNWSN
ncbi:MAG TPA: Tol-Pal system beta propeller repeat protein TolB [Terriglobia bacterium]|jgi:TolB protein|nr:Tol-Pal system beta propeller repeat protein TolB [Terriglobia bacterium]